MNNYIYLLIIFYTVVCYKQLKTNQNKLFLITLNGICCQHVPKITFNSFFLNMDVSMYAYLIKCIIIQYVYRYNRCLNKLLPYTFHIRLRIRWYTNLSKKWIYCRGRTRWACQYIMVPSNILIRLTKLRWPETNII